MNADQRLLDLITETMPRIADESSRRVLTYISLQLTPAGLAKRETWDGGNPGTANLHLVAKEHLRRYMREIPYDTAAAD